VGDGAAHLASTAPDVVAAARRYAVHRSLIIARMTPGAENDVAGIFARSDATSMPYDIGVRQRQLFIFRDLYVHLVDFDREVGEAMARAQRLPAFREISRDLGVHISAYDPATWSSPRDAMARCFYEWTSNRDARR
jgi:cyclase